MKTSIITRLCVLAASLCLFAAVTGCLEMTPFPEPDSVNTVEDLYTLEYQASMSTGVMRVTFSPETDIYNFIDNMNDFSGSIDKCELHIYDDDGVASGLIYDGGDCSQLDSAAARSGDPITVTFEMNGPNIIHCGDQCQAKIVLGVTVSGTVPNQAPFADVVLNDEVATYEAPHFNPQILNNERTYLDLRDADIVGNCTGDHEVWDAAGSMCVCETGYEYALGLSTVTCVAESGTTPDPDPNADPDPDPDPETDDTDGDGIVDAEDNCPEHVNYQQFDVDNDGIGNICDDNISSSQASEVDNFGGGNCSLNVAANSASTFDVLPLLMVVSLIAIRRRFRKNREV